jgi:hypothetical protein
VSRPVTNYGSDGEYIYRSQGRIYEYQETGGMYRHSVIRDPVIMQVGHAYTWPDLSESAPTLIVANLVYLELLESARLLQC